MRDTVTSYRTVAGDGDAEIEVRRSPFLCRVRRVGTEEEARAVVEAARREHWDARHHCSAFVRRQRAPRCSAPATTASRPGRRRADARDAPRPCHERRGGRGHPLLRRRADTDRLARTVAELTGGAAAPVVVGQDWVDRELTAEE